jgi:hypothetical protein
MTLATNMRSTALRLLTTYGDTISCIRYASGDYQPSTGGVSVLSETPYTVLGVAEEYKPYELNNQTILATDVKLTCYSANTTPIVGDKVTFNNVDYRIQKVSITYLQGQNICYTLQLRQ